MYDADLMDLSKSVVAAARLPTTSLVCEEVAARCLALVQPAVRSWKSKGLVVLGHDNVLVKCPLFRNLWEQEMQRSPKKNLLNISASNLSSRHSNETSQTKPPSHDKSPKKVWSPYYMLLYSAYSHIENS